MHPDAGLPRQAAVRPELRHAAALLELLPAACGFDELATHLTPGADPACTTRTTHTAIAKVRRAYQCTQAGTREFIPFRNGEGLMAVLRDRDRRAPAGTRVSPQRWKAVRSAVAEAGDRFGALVLSRDPAAMATADW